MSIRSMPLTVIIAAMAVFVAGCGDDEDDGASAASSNGLSITTSSLSKPQFVKQASDACNREREDLLAEVNAYLKKNDSSQLSEGVVIARMVKAVLVPTIEAEIAAIRKLGAPEGDEEEIEAMLAAQQKGVEEVKQLKSAKTLEVVEDHFQEASKMLRDYGFEACTNSP